MKKIIFETFETCEEPNNTDPCQCKCSDFENTPVCPIHPNTNIGHTKEELVEKSAKALYESEENEQGPNLAQILHWEDLKEAHPDIAKEYFEKAEAVYAAVFEKRK